MIPVYVISFMLHYLNMINSSQKYILHPYRFNRKYNVPVAYCLLLDNRLFYLVHIQYSHCQTLFSIVLCEEAINTPNVALPWHSKVGNAVVSRKVVTGHQDNWNHEKSFFPTCSASNLNFFSFTKCLLVTTTHTTFALDVEANTLIRVLRLCIRK